MTYEKEAHAMLYNCLGGWTREVCQIYWDSYNQSALKASLENLHLRYA
jgi:hypothetical protein